MTPAESIRIVRGLMAAYPNREIRPETVEEYARMLADLDYGAACEAVAHLKATVRWFPTIAEIRQRVTEAAAGAGGGEEAWAELKRAFGVVGYMREPAWSSTVMARAVAAMGGWRLLCESEEPEGVLRAHFMRVYDALRSRALTNANTGALLPCAIEPTPALASPVVLELAEGKRLR
jgi:hypothetical protein